MGPGIWVHLDMTLRQNYRGKGKGGEETTRALPRKPIKVPSSFQPSSVWLLHPTDSWGHYTLAGNGWQQGDRKLDSGLNPSHLPVFVCLSEAPTGLPLHIPARLCGVRRLTVWFMISSYLGFHLNPEPKALEAAGNKPALNENMDFSLRQEVEPLKVKGDS